MQPPNVLVQATALSLGYAQRPVLRDVHFTIRTGEFWFCLGLNGAGKTTLLQALMGGVRPQAGQLAWHPGLRGRQSIGFVPQQCALNPTLPTTVREFVLLGTVGTSQGWRERRTALHWALTRVGLAALAQQNYWSLSGGQQQRALVARALVRRPQLLLLDEPTSGFDPPTTEELLHCLATLNRQEGVSLFCVTHDLTLVMRYATHLALLAQGQVWAGPVQSILQQHTLTNVYGTAITVTHDVHGAATVHVARAGVSL
ncbi:MAG: metal ABC transporter ATP-binding protein [Candidatus Tectomicrobia bacterium]|uniref:Metal ABC transporter ATP-binding protein n=1 Tax=Tectimicrobiota bacterium TaxID=2528274 RepID=A0A938B2S5_UNCTE|nr:metal ABC transporter ATP-binding protein [Candidatus Tectomicrobia bacterium]